MIFKILSQGSQSFLAIPLKKATTAKKQKTLAMIIKATSISRPPIMQYTMLINSKHQLMLQCVKGNFRAGKSSDVQGMYVAYGFFSE
jgi:hypothetical protein